MSKFTTVVPPGNIDNIRSIGFANPTFKFANSTEPAHFRSTKQRIQSLQEIPNRLANQIRGPSFRTTCYRLPRGGMLNPLGIMGVCYALLSFASSALGQGFGQLATNRDGSVLYFSSPLRMKGTDQYLHPKIFSWDPINGARLYLERASDVPFPLPMFGFSGTQFFSLVAPDVSSDGGTTAVTGIRFCNVSDICVTESEEYQSTIYESGQPPLMESGSASLSRSGRFALFRSSIGGLPVPSTMQLLDLQTGQQTQYQGAWLQPGPRHQVANDGTVVVQGFSGGISTGQNGQLDTITSSNATTPLINDSATLIFYESVAGSPAVKELFAFSVPTNTLTSLATDSVNSPGFAASISDDGSQVAFIYGPNRQAYIIQSDGTHLRQITNFPEAVMEVELSGDGSITFAVTATNRIVRIDVTSAQSIDIVPPTPYTNVPSEGGFQDFVSSYRFEVSRGSIVPIPGLGFSANTEIVQWPFPLSLDGVELHVNGSPVLIAGVSPTSISYPVPWDLPDAPIDVEVWVASASTSPFVSGFEVGPVAPSTFVSQPPGPFFLIAVHQDFSSLISSASPAEPGEIIHIYAKDLGPVNTAPPIGLPAPLSPLALLVPPMSCILNSDTDPNATDPANVLFAGLAPELLNVFQMDVRLPASFPGNPSRLLCQIGDPEGYGIFGFLTVGGLP